MSDPTRVGSGLSSKYQTRVEVKEGVNYGRKNFYSGGPMRLIEALIATLKKL